jgi:hypothetical protein
MVAQNEQPPEGKTTIYSDDMYTFTGLDEITGIIPGDVI